MHIPILQFNIGAASVVHVTCTLQISVHEVHCTVQYILPGVPAHEQGSTINFAYIFKGSGAHTSSWKTPLKRKKSSSELFQIIHLWLHGRVCRSLPPVLYTYTCSCLFIKGAKVGLALPVAVQNTPGVILTRIPQP